MSQRTLRLFADRLAPSIFIVAGLVFDSHIAKTTGKPTRLIEIFQRGMQSLRTGERSIEGLVALAWVEKMDAKGIVTLPNISLRCFPGLSRRFFPRPFRVIPQRAESKIVDAESERDESEG